MNTLLDALVRHPAPRRQARLRLPRAAAARRTDLLHRRRQRPARGARPGAHPPGPHGPARLVPHADQARPARRLRPLPRARSRTTPSSTRPSAPRRARAHHERLLAGDDRAGLLDGADLRAPRGRGAVRLGRHRRGDDDRSSRAPRSTSTTSTTRRARSRSTRPATRSPRTSYMKGAESTRLSIRMRGGALGHHQALEKEERFSSWRTRRWRG